MFLCQKNYRVTVFQHVLQPFFRVRRVQRHIGSSRLQYGQQTHDHLKAALHTDRHPLIRLHSQLPEIVRQPVGSGIQLPVAQFLLFKHYRRCLGTPTHLLFEQLMHTLVPRILLFRVVPLIHQLAVLAAGKNGQLTYR